MKVLIVEDNPIIQRMYGRTLSELGYTVVTADNGLVAIDIALKEIPNVILMDVMMPQMNGIEALKAIKADDRIKNIPVLMLSAYDDAELMQQALTAGAKRYLLKSTIDPSEAANAIQQVLTETAPTDLAPPVS
jgi:CheY-like chemotaxis protein